MDSNVSKNTNSHKFFKIILARETIGISLKNLLKQELLSILDIYQQKLNVQLDRKFIDSILEDKINLSQSNYGQLSSKILENQLSSQANPIPIIYSCPLALSLASKLKQSPSIISEQLSNLLVSQQDIVDLKSQFELGVKMTSFGWIDFYFDSRTIKIWLERSQLLILNSSTSQNSFLTPLEKTPANLFSSQYIHARCCSLLRLGAREKLIVIHEDLAQIGWQIAQPAAVSWSDKQDNLWLTELSEYELLKQLFVLTDSWIENNKNLDWTKIVLNLSQSTAIFLADCHFLGEIKQQKPEKAIARLGLIALVQYWLQKILVEKLKVTAPREL